MSNLTNFQLIKVFSENKYVLIRFSDNDIVGINCKIGLISAKKNNPDLNKPSQVMSFRACEIQEYITNKIPFL